MRINLRPLSAGVYFRLCLLLLICAGARAVPAVESLAARLQGVRAGQTVTLPAGCFRGGVRLPAGVSLRGAGCGKTSIVADGADYALQLDGSRPVLVSDLTVQGGNKAGIFLSACHRVTLARVRMHGSNCGVLAVKAQECRLENCLCDGNWVGLSLDGESNTVVNCTVTSCAAVGLAFHAGSANVAFNNCISNTAIGISIDQSAHVQLDYNLYDTLRCGVWHNQPVRSLGAWAQRTGNDRHSVSYPVRYRDPAAGDFSPISPLPWSLERSTASGWGAASFAGVSAPSRDLAGVTRPPRPGLGACEARLTAPRPADCTFTVTSSGLTSAGLFTPAGVLVAYLFHDLPLAAGSYPCWLPARTWEGKPLAPGGYQLRLTTSALSLRLLATFSATAPGNASALEENLPRFWLNDGALPIRLDAHSRRRLSDALCPLPWQPRSDGMTSVGEFTDGAARFVVRTGVAGDDAQILVCRAEQGLLTPVLSLGIDPTDWSWVERKDAQGHLSTAPATPLTDALGAPLRYGSLVNPWTPVQVEPNGDLLVLWGVRDSFLWKRHGLDEYGIPIYRAADRTPLPSRDIPISPYDGQPNGVFGYRALSFAPDGGYTVNVATRGSNPGGSTLFGVGSDLAAFTRDGALRWWRALRDTGGLCGLGQLDEITVAGIFGTPDVLAVDADGLGLGTLSSPGAPANVAEARPGRFFLYREADSVYLLAEHGLAPQWHSYRLDGSQQITRSHIDIAISPAQAQILCGQATPRPEVPTFHVPQLTHPLPVDGELTAWQQAVPAPQVLLLPRPGLAVQSPTDCSGLVRIAHDRQDLYVQVIRFANTVTFHQLYTRSWMQDTVELMLNGYFTGSQWSISRFAEVGAAVVRRGGGGADRLFTPTSIPLSVTVLDSATDIPERRLLEMLYGVQLAKCKVIVTEMKLPIEAQNFDGLVQGVFPLTPGNTAWLGIMLDVNGIPGSDEQRPLCWPDTYGTFTPKEQGGLMVFD